MRGPVAADRAAAADPTPGHVDQDGDRAEGRAASMAGGHVGVVGGGTAHTDHTLAELPGQLAGAVGVEVEHHDAQPEAVRTDARWPSRARPPRR